MTNGTKNVINDFKHFIDLQSLKDYLNDIHKDVMHQLLGNNIKLYDNTSQFAHEVVAGQTFSDMRIVNLIKFYQELTHIKKGLEGNWIHHVDEYERYASIKEAVEQIINKLT